MHGFGTEERSGDWLILATRTAAGEGGRCWWIDQGGDCLSADTYMFPSVVSLRRRKKKRQSEISPYSQARVVMYKEMIEMEN